MFLWNVDSQLPVYRTVTSHSTQICTCIATGSLNISLWISLTHCGIITKIYKQNIWQDKRKWIKLIISKAAHNSVRHFLFLCHHLTITQIPRSELKQKTVHSLQLFYSIQLLQNSINLHSWSQSIKWIGILRSTTRDVLKREWLLNGCLF